MRGTSGMLLIAIGVLHTVFGIVQGYAVLSQIGAAAFPSEASRQSVMGLGRNYVFWFLFGGVMMLLLGQWLVWLERRLVRPVPAFIGWELLLVSVAGVAILPRSGFWLILALGAYIIVTARRRGAAAT